MENYFNLVEEKWIPIVHVGRVSLLDVFKNSTYIDLDVTAIERISLLRLLLAIAQSACQIKDDKEWHNLNLKKLSSGCISYLNEHKEDFWLFGEKPFLQFPVLAKLESKADLLKELKQVRDAIKKESDNGSQVKKLIRDEKKLLEESYVYNISQLDYFVSTGNNCILTDINISHDYSFEEIALLVLTFINFSKGTKGDKSKIDKDSNFEKKTAKPGSAIGSRGLLHSFILGNSLLETIKYNLQTEDFINGIYEKGMGQASWEAMPKHENDKRAKELGLSYIGRLVPLNRFIYLLNNKECLFTEGITYPSFNEMIFDLSLLIVKREEGKLKLKWVDTDLRPWKEITSILAFLRGTENTTVCYQIKNAIEKLNKIKIKVYFYIWSGGLSISSNAGEQYLTKNNDLVDSKMYFSNELMGNVFCKEIFAELETLEQLSNVLYMSVKNYFSDLKKEGQIFASGAKNNLWNQSEKEFQNFLLELSKNTENGSNGRASKAFRKKIYNLVKKIYQNICPSESTRQIESFVKNEPKLKLFDKKEERV